MDCAADGRSRDALLGAPLRRIYEHSAIGPLPSDAAPPPSASRFCLLFNKAVGWSMRGLARPNPLFDDRTKAVRSVPQLLSPRRIEDEHRSPITPIDIRVGENLNNGGARSRTRRLRRSSAQGRCLRNDQCVEKDCRGQRCLYDLRAGGLGGCPAIARSYRSLGTMKPARHFDIEVGTIKSTARNPG